MRERDNQFYERKESDIMPKKKRKKYSAAMSALAGVAVWAVIGAVCVLSFKTGGQEIGTTQLIQRVKEPQTAPIDTDKLKSSIQYVDISELSPNDSLLAISKGNVPAAKLQPVYNAVFSKKGLQIVSLSDSTLKCRSEAVVPLSSMFDAFYNETKLRTIMITKAYEPYSPPPEPEYVTDENGQTVEVTGDTGKCSEHNNGYSFDMGIYLQESDSRRELTLEGQYNWFKKHSWEYGFVQRYPQGAEQLTGKPNNESHFRYVGKVAARIMNDNSICFEQLQNLMEPHTIDDPVVIDGNVIVYLCKLTDDSREVPVPILEDGTIVPHEVYYLGKGQKTVLIAAQAAAELAAAENTQTQENAESSNG